MKSRSLSIDTLDKLKYGNISALLKGIALNDTNNQVKIKAIMGLGKYGSERDLIFLERLAPQSEYKDANLNKAINIAHTKLNSKISNKSLIRNQNS